MWATAIRSGNNITDRVSATRRANKLPDTSRSSEGSPVCARAGARTNLRPDPARRPMPPASAPAAALPHIAPSLPPLNNICLSLALKAPALAAREPMPSPWPLPFAGGEYTATMGPCRGDEAKAVEGDARRTPLILPDGAEELEPEPARRRFFCMAPSMAAEAGCPRQTHGPRRPESSCSVPLQASISYHNKHLTIIHASPWFPAMLASTAPLSAKGTFHTCPEERRSEETRAAVRRAPCYARVPVSGRPGCLQPVYLGAASTPGVKIWRTRGHRRRCIANAVWDDAVEAAPKRRTVE